MPKIPTFTAEARPTAQATGVVSNIKVNVNQSVGAALAPLGKSVEDYYIKQRDNNEKLEAKQKFYEMKAESDKIQKSQEKNPDDLSAVNTYNQEFGQYRKQKLSQIKNKRVRKKLELLLDSDQAENVYKIKSASFKALEDQNLSMYNTEQNTLAAEYSLTNDPNLKDIAKQKRIESAKEFENMNLMGKPWLDKAIQTINTDSAIFDADVAIANGNYNKAKEILLTAKNVDSEEMQKRIITIEKQKIEYDATGFGVQQILEGKNPLIGPPIKGTTDQKVLNATDNYLLGIAEKNNLNEEKTFAYVDGVFTPTGLLSPRYEEIIQAGFTAGSATTFDNLADIPPVLIQAVKAAESMEKLGRLNVYTTADEERFFRNIIISKRISGANDYQAIKNAKEFEMNYNINLINGSKKYKNATLKDIQNAFISSPWFGKNTNITNIGEVKSYAEKIFNLYVANDMNPKQAQKQVVEDLKKDLQVVDDHAYMKRDIDSFKYFGGLDEVKPMKEYIIKTQMTDEDPDDFYLSSNGGGVFEVKSRIGIYAIFNKDNKPMIYYPKDLLEINKERKSEVKGIIKKETIESQAEKTKNKEQTTSDLLNIAGS